MDCTLRDGGNVMGKGFDAEITDMVLDGLTACGVPIIEFGNAGGIGAYEVAGFTQALTDQEYLDIGKKYLGRGSELGMFLNVRRYREKNVDIAKENGLSFLRIGEDAGDGEIALTQIADIKKRGMKVYYSMMKAYILSPQELAMEAKKLEDAGLDEVTIMDLSLIHIFCCIRRIHQTQGEGSGGEDAGGVRLRLFAFPCLAIPMPDGHAALPVQDLQNLSLIHI